MDYSTLLSFKSELLNVVDKHCSHNINKESDKYEEIIDFLDDLLYSIARMHISSKDEKPYFDKHNLTIGMIELEGFHRAVIELIERIPFTNNDDVNRILEKHFTNNGIIYHQDDNSDD